MPLALATVDISSGDIIGSDANSTQVLHHHDTTIPEMAIRFATSLPHMKNFHNAAK